MHGARTESLVLMDLTSIGFLRRSFPGLLLVSSFLEDKEITVKQQRALGLVGSFDTIRAVKFASL